MHLRDCFLFLDELEVVEGMRFDRGFISPYFITDPKTQACVLENPAILLVGGKVSTIQSVLPVLEEVLRAGRPLAIIAEDVEGEALAALIINKIRGSAKVVAIKAPGFGDQRKAMMTDLATLTGATLSNEEVGVKLEEMKLDDCGSCGKVKLPVFSERCSFMSIFISILAHRLQGRHHHPRWCWRRCSH